MKLMVGATVILMSVLLIVFPTFWLNLKSPETLFIRLKKINKEPKIIKIVRIWGGICLIIGI